jgi:hypothetical protein
MRLKKLKIFKATEAFLYLPIYIAKDLKIFETLLECDEVEIDETSGGDINAITTMFEENKKTDIDPYTIAIAIADPIVLLQPNMPENVKIVGAVINKSTFWAVSTRKKGNTINLKNDSILICPNENYRTGNYWGEKTRKKENIEKKELVEFGEEITKFKDISERNDSQVTAITADIAALVDERNDGWFRITKSFSTNGEFLTTGIIVSKESCEKYIEVIEKIIEAIQTSITILYSSKITAKRICADIAKAKFSDKFSGKEINEHSKQIEKIIDLMYDEEFYPNDLSISKESWDKAVEALGDVQGWKSEETEENKASFVRYVDNSFVLKSITKRFGIDLDKSKNTIHCKKDTYSGCYNIIALEKQIDALEKIGPCKKDKNDCSDIKKLQERIYNLETIPLHNVLIGIVKFFGNKFVLIITLLIAIFAIVFFINFKLNESQSGILKEVVSFLAAIVTILGFLVGLVTRNHLSKDKKNEEQSN